MPMTLATIFTQLLLKRSSSRWGCERRSYLWPQRQARLAMKYMAVSPRSE